MFNGIPEQFYQFIDSRTPLSLPFSLPLHVSPPPFSSIDPPPSHPQQLIFQQSHHPFLHPDHHFHQQLHRRQSSTVEDNDEEEEEEEEEEEQQEEEREAVGRTNTELHGLNLKPTSQLPDPWTQEEILALWRIRSTIESGFTDYHWEHVSRKLAEIGIRKSAEKCKEKYDEVSKYCNNSDDNINHSKNCRSFNELEALYEGANPNTTSAKKVVLMSDKEDAKMELESEENSGNETLENPTEEKDFVTRSSRTQKRKRHQKSKLLKRFCEEIVNKIMVQQEELQNKLLHDMEKKEEERMVREEEWRKQEMARMDREIELRARERAIACDRETSIIEFLKTLGSSPSGFHTFLKNEAKNPNQELNPEVPTSSTRTVAAQNPNSLPTRSVNPAEVPRASCTPDLTPQNPKSLATQENPLPHNPNYISSDKEDHGKRWPRNEVYSLINLRCNLYNSEDKEGSKVPLWERISRGMLELGYKRSAKRCKEKWENINKYFRKTRDANKKRSLDSKTCPYFHQLSSLYNQGKLALSSEGPENHLSSPENRSESPVIQLRSPENGLEENAQAPTLEFEY